MQNVRRGEENDSGNNFNFNPPRTCTSFRMLRQGRLRLCRWNRKRIGQLTKNIFIKQHSRSSSNLPLLSNYVIGFIYIFTREILSRKLRRIKRFKFKLFNSNDQRFNVDLLMIWGTVAQLVLDLDDTIECCLECLEAICWFLVACSPQFSVNVAQRKKITEANLWRQRM